MTELEQFMFALLGLLMAALMWFVKRVMSGYDKKHEKHFGSTATLELLCATMIQEMKDHARSDTAQFDRMNNSLDVIHDDIKTLIAKVH